jgi:pimeloyl-ACP methyl ester carboxylesterase
MSQHEIELSAGPIMYEDSGGDGPVIVLIHGLLMTGSLWDMVVKNLGPRFRCIRPTLPLGAHRQPMRPDADLSLRGLIRLLVEFLERLDLWEVTLVFNDWCGAQLLVAEGWDGRVGRLILASCETDDNYPPGLPGRVAALAAAVPGGLAAALKPLRLRVLRRLPMTFRPTIKAPDPRPAGRRVAGAGPDPARDPARPAQVRRCPGGQARVDQRHLAPGWLRQAGPGHLGRRGPGDADPGRPAAGGVLSRFPVRRDSRQPHLAPIDQPQALAGVIASFADNH